MPAAMNDSLLLADRSRERSSQPALWVRTRGKPLAGVTILIVEDEALLAFDLRDSFEEAGAAVVGPVPSLSAAIRAATEERFDVAILDIDLQGMDVFPAAEILLERDLPFFFHTGHADHSDLPEKFADTVLYPKPGCPSELIRVLLELIRSHRSAH